MRRHQKQRGDCGVGHVRGRGASAPGPHFQQPRSWGTRSRLWELGQVPTQGSAVAPGKWPLLSHPNLFLCSFVRGTIHPALACLPHAFTFGCEVLPRSSLAMLLWRSPEMLLSFPTHLSSLSATPREQKMQEVGAVSQGDPIPTEHCQRCFRQWLHTHTAGRANQDGAHGSVLFPSPSSSRHFQAHIKSVAALRRPQASWVRQPEPGSPV